LNISLSKKKKERKKERKDPSGHCELVDWKEMALVNKIGIYVVKVMNCHIDGSTVCLGVR